MEEVHDGGGFPSTRSSGYDEARTAGFVDDAELVGIERDVVPFGAISMMLERV
jgi:hypothetical protein